MTRREKLLKLFELSRFKEDAQQALAEWVQIVKEMAEAIQANSPDTVFYDPDELSNIVSLDEFLSIVMDVVESQFGEAELDWLISVLEHPMGRIITEVYPNIMDEAIDPVMQKLIEKTNAKLEEMGIILPGYDNEGFDLGEPIEIDLLDPDFDEDLYPDDPTA